MGESNQASSRQALTGTLMVTAVFALQGFVPTPDVNETHYLAKAKHYWDASFCSGDFFLDSADAHLAFYWTVGWITRLASLPVAAWIGRIAAWLWLAWSWQRLASTLRMSPLKSALAALLFVAGIAHGNFAGEWVVGGVEAKCFAYGFVLLGLAAIAESRWLAMGVHFGAASALHVLVGGWAVLAGLLVWSAQSGSRRTAWRQLAKGLVLGGILSLAGLLPALALTAQASPAERAAAAEIYVFQRLPHHLAPLALKPDELLRKMVRFGLLTATLFGLWRWCASRLEAVQARGPEPDLEGLLRIMQLAGVAVIANGVGALIQACLVDDPESAARVLRYYWFRQADVMAPLAVALGIVKLASEVPRRVGQALLAVAVIVAAMHVSTMPVFTKRPWAPPADKRLTDAGAWSDACHWVRRHAPAKAVFLVPWEGQSFKWHAHRADVVNRKDIPQDARGLIEWARRRDLVFPSRIDGRLRLKWTFKNRSSDALRQIARQVGATHLISSDATLRLKSIYRNDYYTIYQIAEDSQ